MKLGQPALALTDHGTLSGSLHHYQACNDAGILPIMGCEVYFKPNRHLKDNDNKTFYHLVLIAKNLEGWHNLIRITSEAYASGFYYKPCVDFELLDLYSEGLICQTACISSYMNKALLGGDDKGFWITLGNLRRIFRDDLFIEIMPHDFDDQRYLNKELIRAAEEKSIPVIATVDAHYPYKSWADTQDVILMMSTGQTLSKRAKKAEKGEDVYKFDCDTLYLMDREEVYSTFKDFHPDLTKEQINTAIDNTYEVMRRVDPFLIDKKRKSPKVKGNPEDIVWNWCLEGMERIGKRSDPVYVERLEYEFGVLKKNEALDYFAIVGDLVRWSIDNGIRLGAGRGSAAGCLVSYLIGITGLDPIAHGLLFERFMNPDRKGMPDIDLDFQSDRRDEAKKYLADKYGEDHVANVVAHQTFKPRACIQKVGRVFDVYNTSFTTEQIDPLETMDLSRLAQLNERVGKFAQENPDAWIHAKRVQGQVHTQSKHAAAVVVTDKPVAEYMPTMRGKKDEVLTQWGARADFNIIDEYGFLKIDLLGISGLEMQEHACDMIEKRTGERIKLNELELLKDPYACDPKVLDGFNRGLVLGVFQFTGSSGFARLIKSLRADWLGDLGACNALYRPGPLGTADKAYANRKHGREKVEYYHESVEEVTKETYGLIVYQEQIMELVKRMAGFTGGEADTFRKAISKEYRLGLDHVIKFLEDKGFKSQFWEGCTDNGISEAVIDEVWNAIIAFGEYGFNKSHAYAYAVQSYQDMYLKVHYPTEFYAALLTHNPDLSMRAVREARHFGVDLVPPDINKSMDGFSVRDGKILYGLRGVKNLGDVGVEKILQEQPFRSYEDFCERIPPRMCNKRAKDSLLGAGAFDVWDMRKGWSEDEKAEAEKEAIGVAISQTQIVAKYQEMVRGMVNTPQYLLEADDGDGIVVGGEVASLKEIKTRRGQAMGFITVELGVYNWNVTLFPEQWEEYTDLLQIGKPVMIRGRKYTRDTQDVVVTADVMVAIEELAMELTQND